MDSDDDWVDLVIWAIVMFCVAILLGLGIVLFADWTTIQQVSEGLP